MKKLVLWLLILLLPTQLGYHFWPGFSFVAGYKIDYLSPIIYLTDLVLVFHLVLNYKKLKPSSLFFGLAILNTFFSKQPLLSLFFWSKLSLYYLFFLSLLKTPNLKRLVRTPLLTSTVLVIFTQIAQLLLQKSLGGPLYFLGERAFNFYTPHLAKINLPFLSTIIRPYSIFSHPNSLAGYLLLTLLIFKSKKIKTLISLAIILTFSKAAIITLLLLQIKNIKILKKAATLALLAGFLPLLVVFTNLSYVPGDSFLTRAFMGYPTLEIIKQNFLTGTGLRGFIPSLPQHLSPAHLNLSSLQPVHSLPLLVLAELGLTGLIFIISLVKHVPFSKTLFVVILTGAVDHYWWTLPQNQLILILALALGERFGTFGSPSAFGWSPQRSEG